LAPSSACIAGWNALLISSVYNGVAHAARDWLREFLHSRVPARIHTPQPDMAYLAAGRASLGSLIPVSRAAAR
jgi:hypothetical protein